MFEGSPEHDFFSQPQLKFPMFVFSFTMFSVKENFWGGDAARDRTHVSDKRDSLRLCWSSSTWWTLVHHHQPQTLVRGLRTTCVFGSAGGL